MREGPCNKCGERRELVLADCVCASCSNALDKQCANSIATDWVLIAVDDRGSIHQFVYRDTTYAQMKSNWAKFNTSGHWSGSRRVSAEEIAQMESQWGTWMQPSGPANSFIPQGTARFIRPATWEDLAKHYEGRLNWQRESQAYEIWDETVGMCGSNEQTVEELRSRLEKSGLLGDALKQGWFPDLGEAVRNRDERIPRTAQLETATQISATEKPKGGGHETGVGRGLSQVVGMTDLKEQLLHDVIGPFRAPEIYRRYRVSLPNGILFYGPPGCGKTYIARSLAAELGWHFQYCRPSDVASPYIHDTVSRIRALFSTAIEQAPSIVFIDEFEAFVPARSDLGGHQQYKAEEVNEFLANLEGCAERKVLVIAATNEPDRIDPAVRRSGRFDKLIFIPPPDAEARRAMLDFHLKDRPVQASVETAGIATVLEGYSASDIKLLVDEAARMALKRAEPISTSTLLVALEKVPASITNEDIQRYSAFRSRGI